MPDNGSCISAVRPYGATDVSVSVCGSEYSVMLCFGAIARTLLDRGFSLGLLLSVLRDVVKDVGGRNG